MRFKTSVRNIGTFTKLTQSLSSIGKIAWLRLSTDDIRFVIQAAEGTQVWANLSIVCFLCTSGRAVPTELTTQQATLFADYRIASANNNIINLEVPLAQLHRALRSCVSASDAVLRLTKRASDGVPILCLTITTAPTSNFLAGNTLVTQEIPVRVLSATSVENIVEPRAPEADVHIYLPSLPSIRGIADRFNKLSSFSAEPHRLVLAANMSGEFKMALRGTEVSVESRWRDLQNPVLADGEREDHPSTLRDRLAFAEARVDGKEWAKVLKVGGLAKRVVACICDGVAVILYVFLSEEADFDPTVVTYYMNSIAE